MALRREGRAPHLTRPTGLAGEVGLLRQEVADELASLPSSMLPLASGTASAGTSTEYARADHVHPAVSAPKIACDIEEGAIDFQSRPAPSTTGDFASIPGALVPDAGPWTIAFFFTPTSRHSAGGILAAKWNNGGTRGFVVERFGDGVIVYFAAGSNSAYTLDTLFAPGVEREIAIGFNGAGATSADRIKVSSRLTGGTWTTHTLTFAGTIPTSITVSGAPVTFARAFGSAASAVSANFRMRDLRIFSAAIVPAGTSDLSLTSLSSRYRFRSLVGATTPDEITGAPMTLTHTLGGPLRPAREVVGWQAGTYPLGPRILTIGDSKTSGSSAARGAWRHEACNQLAAVWGRRPTFVGRFADADARAEFVYNSRHSGLGGTLLSGTILTRCTDDVIAYAPDVVVLEGGTNDALAGASATTIRDRMGVCIDAVLAASPACRVIVMSDPTVSAITLPTEYAVLATYNGLLGALVASKGPRVSFVDVYPLTCEDYLWDSAHMLEPGYARVGEEIAAAIANLL